MPLFSPRLEELEQRLSPSVSGFVPADTVDTSGFISTEAVCREMDHTDAPIHVAYGVAEQAHTSCEHLLKREAHCDIDPGALVAAHACEGKDDHGEESHDSAEHGAGHDPAAEELHLFLEAEHLKHLAEQQKHEEHLRLHALEVHVPHAHPPHFHPLHDHTPHPAHPRHDHGHAPHPHEDEHHQDGDPAHPGQPREGDGQPPKPRPPEAQQRPAENNNPPANRGPVQENRPQQEGVQERNRNEAAPPRQERQQQAPPSNNDNVKSDSEGMGYLAAMGAVGTYLWQKCSWLWRRRKAGK